MATDANNGNNGNEDEACDPKPDNGEKNEELDPKQWRTLTLIQRKYLVEHLVVPHERFNRLMEKINHCAAFGAGGEVPTENPPCIAILGETHAGKTKLIETWLEDAPLVEHETETGTIIPYLQVLIPASPHKKGAAAAFLRALHDPNPSRGTEWDMTARIERLIKRCQVRMIFVDEFQHLNDKDSLRILHSVADFLKNIINQTKVPMVLIGKLGEAEPILAANDQLDRRVGSPLILQPFEWDRHRPETIKEFRTLMQAIDANLPLDSSGLAAEDMAFRFFYASDGFIGWVMEIIRTAAHRAIESGCSCLNLALLADAYDDRVADTARGEGKVNPFVEKGFTEATAANIKPPTPSSHPGRRTRARRGKRG